MEILEHGTPEERSDQDLAIQIGHALNKHYPNHPWVVSFQGHALIIRHLAIAHAMFREIGRDGFGAVMDPTKLDTPTSVMKSAIEFGGMMLENFGLPRKAWDGRDPVIPARYRYKQDRSFN